MTAIDMPDEYDVFVSYVRADRAWVKGVLLSAFEETGISFVEEASFSLGEPTTQTAETAIRASRRVVIVLSQAYLNDRFATTVAAMTGHFGQATDGWPLIPIYLEQVRAGPSIDMLNHLEMWDPREWEFELGRLLTQLGGEDRAATPLPPCPYPGMRPFTAAESGVFHGRKGIIDDLVDRLRTFPVVAVVGPSGSGKSSLALAGVYPRLRGRQSLDGRGWQFRVVRPGRTPYDRLIVEFGLDARAGPDALVARIRDAASHTNLLVVIDQAEEMFTLGDNDGAASRQIEQVAAVLGALASNDSIRVVMTMRADFSTDLVASPLWKVIGSTVYLRPLRGSALGDAIVKPAEGVGVYVEPRLVERLIADAADEPGLLPFVQETMVMLWSRIERRLLTLAGYEALVIPRPGYPDEPRTGLQVAMARHADGAIARLTEPQQAIARRVLLRLVQFGEGRPDVRRQQRIEQLRSSRDQPTEFEDVLNTLVDERLITTDAATLESGSPRRVDLSHEALIAGWPSFRESIVSNAAAENARRRMGQQAETWLDARTGEKVADRDRQSPRSRWWERLRGDRSGVGLLDSLELAEAERWLSRDDAATVGLDESPIIDLVEASRTWHWRRNRLRAAISVTFFVLAGTAAMLGFFAAVQAQRAASEANRATALLLAQTADADPEQQDIAALLGLEAVLRLDSVESRGGLKTALELSPELLHYLPGHDVGVRAVAASPDGGILATGDERGKLLLWSSSVVDTPVELTGHREEVSALAFSPDGAYLASGSRDDTVRIWDLDRLDREPVVLTAEQASPLATGCFPPDNPALSRDVRALAFDPGSTRLAMAGHNGLVEIWRVGSWTRLAELEGHICAITDVEYSPDGLRLATTARDDTVRIWDPFSGETVFQVGEPTQSANDERDKRAVAWHPDGRTFAVGGNDKRVTLHDVEDPGSTTFVTTHAERILAIAFRTDGATLASASADRQINIVAIPRDGEPPRRLAELRGHRDAVRGVAFLPDGRLLSGAQDGTVALWDPERSVRLARPVATQGGTALIIRYVGQFIVAGSREGDVAVWDADTLQPIGSPYATGGKALRDLTALDDRRVAMADAEGRLTAVDVPSMTVESWRGHDSEVRAIVYVEDQGVLVSADLDGVVRVWNPDTQELIDEIRLTDCPVDDIAVDSTTDRLVVACNAAESHELGLSDGRFTGTRASVAIERLVTLTVQDRGELVGGGEDGRVLVWEAGAPLSEGADLIDIVGDEVRAVAIDETEPRRGALGTAQGLVYLWDFDERRVIGEPWSVGFRIHSLDFSTDGTGLVVASVTGAGKPDTALVLNVDEMSWREEVCRLAGRNLTTDEWDRLVGTDEPIGPCDSQPPAGN